MVAKNHTIHCLWMTYEKCLHTQEHSEDGKEYTIEVKLSFLSEQSIKIVRFITRQGCWVISKIR